jgi:cytochrome c6
MKYTAIVIAALTAAAINVHAADVKENWTQNCAKCHGADGKGDTKMGKKLDIKDFTDAAVQAKFTDEQMAKAIKEGVKDGDKSKMKAFGEVLSADEIKALVAHVRSYKK